MKNIFKAVFGCLLFPMVGVFSYALGIQNLSSGMRLMLPLALLALVSGVFYWLFCFKPEKSVTNHLKNKVLVIHLLLIFTLYFIWDALFPSETYVGDFFIGSDMDDILKLITILVLAPIAEELTYRGIVFDSLRRMKKGRFMLILAAITSSSVFTLYHGQYEHVSTFVLLFLVAILLCSARYFSKTLWVPMTVHSFASLCAISL